MGTRSCIMKRISPTEVKAIYCHWDGYLSYNGRLLRYHYQDEVKGDALIALGNLSVLGEEIGEAHDFDHHTENKWCKAYGRDRCEANAEAMSFNTVAEALEHFSWSEYAYIYEKGEWFLVDGNKLQALALMSL